MSAIKNFNWKIDKKKICTTVLKSSNQNTYLAIVMCTGFLVYGIYDRNYFDKCF